MNQNLLIEELKLFHKKNYLLLKIALNEGFSRAAKENNLENMNDYRKMIEELEISYEVAGFTKLGDAMLNN
jgi:hypothetical protein